MTERAEPEHCKRAEILDERSGLSFAAGPFAARAWNGLQVSLTDVANKIMTGFLIVSQARLVRIKILNDHQCPSISTSRALLESLRAHRSGELNCPRVVGRHVFFLSSLTTTCSDRLPSRLAEKAPDLASSRH